MPRLALDSVNAGPLANCRWPHQIGYVNGRVSAWSAEEIAETRAAGRLLALVDVLGTMPLSASVLDFERGDVQSPAVVHAWLQARNQYRGDGTVYCSVASIPTVVSQLRGQRCNLWVVDLTADAEPPFTVPDYPGLPAGVRVIARQFVLGPRSGGNYDMSIIYADDWHPEQDEPATQAAARISAAAELGHYAVAAVRASSTAAADADPKPSSADGTTSSEPLSVPGPAPSTSAGPEPGVLISDATAAMLEAAGVTAAAPPEAWRIGQFTMPSSMSATPPLPAQVMVPPAGSTPPPPTDAELNAANLAAADRQHSAALAAGDPAAWARETAAPSSSSPTSAPSVSVSSPYTTAAPLNHDFIRATLKDLEGVAREFRRGGWPGTAAELERVAGVAWEIGSAIKAAGL